MTPTTVRSRYFVTSSSVLILLSSRTVRKMMPRLMTRPATPPMAVLRIVLGETGSGLIEALEMTLTEPASTDSRMTSGETTVICSQT